MTRLKELNIIDFDQKHRRIHKYPRKIKPSRTYKQLIIFKNAVLPK